MQRLLSLSALILLVTACSKGEVDEDPLPEFIDDCGGLNDDLLAPAGLLANDGEAYTARLCPDDIDVYRIDVPAHSWLSLQMVPEHGGDGDSDLDMWQLDDPDNPVDPRLDFVDLDADDAERNVLWYSATAQSYERLAWYNPGDERMSRFVAIDGYEGAYDDYELELSVSDWHEGMECDDSFPDADPRDQDGPCNQVMQFPQANAVDDGYLVTHEAHYSNVRREVAYLVRWAAAETALAFDDTNPLALMDMSEDDGDTPGRMRGQLRHPEGTHVNGNDMDIAYYQTGDDNYGREVCSSHDQYFCQGPADLLDARRTAYFMMMLMRSPQMRVIGVDPEIATDVRAAANDLRDEGLVESSDVSNLGAYMAYGDGWPFHHHHMHLSWQWEDGWTDRTRYQPEGCTADDWAAAPAFTRVLGNE